MDDLINRQAAIDNLMEIIDRPNHAEFLYTDEICGVLRNLPSLQLERDIPIKPIETTDKAWGIPYKQAVCPKCDCYLSHISFLGDYKGKRITYCETCGQAIDWEGWDWDE